MSIEKVFIRGVEIEVKFTFHKGFKGSYYEPKNDPEIEVEEIIITGDEMNVTSWLGIDLEDEIITALFELRGME